MNGINIYSIIVTIILCILGYFTSYIKTKTMLINKASDFINKAEEDYKGATKAGQYKFEAVVEWLYNLVPIGMRFFITRQMISEIVQKVFDKMAEYATKQLDKIVDDITAVVAFF